MGSREWDTNQENNQIQRDCINWINGPPDVNMNGGRLGIPYSPTSFMAPGGHEITARQRWNPTPVQLQILMQICDQGNVTPSKEMIKEITSDLRQHGQVSEPGVFNWFQSRRSRLKRNQLVESSNNAESEVETEVDSLNNKKKNQKYFTPIKTLTTALRAALNLVSWVCRLF